MNCRGMGVNITMVAVDCCPFFLADGLSISGILRLLTDESNDGYQMLIGNGQIVHKIPQFHNAQSLTNDTIQRRKPTKKSRKKRRQRRQSMADG